MTDPYKGAQVFINKQTFEYEYIKELVGMIMGAACGWVVGDVINNAVASKEKYYKISGIDNKEQSCEFKNNTLSLYNPNYFSSYGQIDSYKIAFDQANMAYTNFKYVNEDMTDYLSNQYDINDSLAMLAYYLEFKINRHANNDLCRMYAIIVHKEPKFVDLTPEDKSIIEELYKRYTSSSTTTVVRSIDNVLEQQSELIDIFRNVRLEEKELDTKIDNVIDAVNSLSQVKELQSKIAIPPIQTSSAVTKENLLRDKRTKYKDLLKAHVDRNPLVVKWGEKPQEIQRISIIQEDPWITPSVLTIGINIISIGYGAIFGAKYINKIIL